MPGNRSSAEAGTWKYNKSSNALVLESDLIDEFNGEGIILDLSEKELITEKEDVDDQ